MDIVLMLLIVLTATKLAGDLTVRLGQPSVLGKLIVGIIVGPAVLGWVTNGEIVRDMAEVGVILLMFIAGLETDLDQLKQNWKASVAVALGGIILPFIGGYLGGIALGLDQGQSLFIGLLLCATSVSISVQTLKDLGQLSSREGTTILGAAVVDDVVVVILLAFMLSLLGAGTDQASLGWIVGKKVIFFAGAIAAGIYAVPLLMRWLAPLKVSEAVISAALIICFAFSYAAEQLGVAGIIGAFAAGIAISQTDFKQEVEHRLEPIAYGIFVPVFFVSVGLEVTFAGLGQHVGFMLLFSVLAIATKLFGCMLGARMTGFGRRSAFGIGSGMVSRGEVALIIATAGLEGALFDPALFTPLVIIIIVTTLVTPPMLKLAFRHGGNRS
ncbi:cation:proton antiporter [Paenibacillus melissococcoides]|uniref:Cation:proton antiporter n=1 Tax=Paenibacillus melissococcoides TaxID=2912268 RepID=A0ABM9FWR3_9BACL|nr:MULTISPECIES: cation:proton antiporter [Paenibacillus]MEB9895407.1 cation:proton antiporter [Bacillus cereus]CAH8243412.1 cation:proton antiporter [Paenibacillus melissococcoides]CAH8704437.1 cation:proton antiporter [Paenibacillus melissococcoides]CAH8707706.1 cation:proton antiporter [Paenibacillus melissococcoides]GIO76536.1 sodium:proton antiporter [Paenibacillus dendritiformis]